MKNRIAGKNVLEVEPGEKTILHLAAKCGQAHILNWLAQYLN